MSEWYGFRYFYDEVTDKWICPSAYVETETEEEMQRRLCEIYQYDLMYVV